MNQTIKDSGGDLEHGSIPQTGICAPRAAEKPDSAKLAAVILENQAKIDKGWEELRKLDEMLALVQQLQVSVHPATRKSP